MLNRRNSPGLRRSEFMRVKKIPVRDQGNKKTKSRRKAGLYPVGLWTGNQ